VTAVRVPRGSGEGDSPTRHNRAMEIVVVMDCQDPEALADFWCGVLRYRRARRTGPYLALLPHSGQEGPELLLQAVPEAKVGKNRLHLDVRTDDLVAEVDRVRMLGATTVSAGLLEEGAVRWFVMADPEGNEFCVLADAESR
jgi:predicted enzyme related to lactoylglutathione lyase